MQVLASQKQRRKSRLCRLWSAIWRKAEAEKQAIIAELEDYMKNHLGDAVEIKAKITATRKELWDVRDKLNDKKMKLEQAKLQLDELQKNTSHIEARNREIKADFEKQLFHTSNR